MSVLGPAPPGATGDRPDTKFRRDIDPTDPPRGYYRTRKCAPTQSGEASTRVHARQGHEADAAPDLTVSAAPSDSRQRRRVDKVGSDSGHTDCMGERPFARRGPASPQDGQTGRPHCGHLILPTQVVWP